MLLKRERPLLFVLWHHLTCYQRISTQMISLAQIDSDYIFPMLDAQTRAGSGFRKNMILWHLVLTFIWVQSTKWQMYYHDIILSEGLKSRVEFLHMCMKRKSPVLKCCKHAPECVKIERENECLSRRQRQRGRVCMYVCMHVCMYVCMYVHTLMFACLCLQTHRGRDREEHISLVFEWYQVHSWCVCMSHMWVCVCVCVYKSVHWRKFECFARAIGLSQSVITESHSMYVCIHAHMHVCLFVCIHSCMYVCMYVCHDDICIHVCMHVCM